MLHWIRCLCCFVVQRPSGLAEFHPKLLTNRIPNVFPHFAATHSNGFQTFQKRKSWIVTVHPQRATVIYWTQKPRLGKMIFRIQRAIFRFQPFVFWAFSCTKQLISSTRQRLSRMHLNKFSTSFQFRESPAASALKLMVLGDTSNLCRREKDCRYIYWISISVVGYLYSYLDTSIFFWRNVPCVLTYHLLA